MDDRLLDRRWISWLQDGPATAPGGLLEAVIDHARLHPRQASPRMRWSLAMRALGAQRRFALAPVRPFVALALLLLAVALGGVVYFAAQLLLVAPQPTPTPIVPPSPAAVFACPGGSDPDQAGPADQERPPVGYWAVALDRSAGQLVALGGTESAGLWTFDVCTNTWQRIEVGAGRLSLPGTMAYHEPSDRILFPNGPWMTAFDVGSGQLQGRQAPPLEIGHIVYRSAATTIVARDDGASRLWTYDAWSDEWRPLDQFGEIPPYGGNSALLAYDAHVDRLVLYWRQGEPARTYEYDFNSSAWARYDEPPEISLVWGDIARREIAYDEIHQRTVIFSRGRAIAYDATTHTWEVVFKATTDASGAPAVAHRDSVALAYDSINQRVLVIGGGWSRKVDALRNEYVRADGVIAFDLGTRTWTTLLEQSTP